jgi:hypothetical protein
VQPSDWRAIRLIDFGCGTKAGTLQTEAIVITVRC